MKKVLFISIPLLLMAYLIVITLIPRTKPENLEAQNTASYNQVQETNYNKNIPSSHFDKSINCKTCHACEYPTKEDPCLLDCPRESMVSVNHSPKEGPEVVVINEMSEYYSGVVFSHKIHAEMSDISTGCTGCHHFNTTGPVMNCKKCHDSGRQREDVSIPDLKAAYHRQCMTCHKQWSGDNSCNTLCHSRKDENSTSKLQQTVKEISGKQHPIMPKPSKMIWETGYDKGKIVTFFHDEHVQLFKLRCADCHSGDNCTKCHASKTQNDYSKTLKISKTTEEHHKPCFSCHSDNPCKKCHMQNEMLPFNHERAAGWGLSSHHISLECSKCHGKDFQTKKPDPNCTSCHKNFVKGEFDHKLAGLKLSEVHAELDCNSCHLQNNFAKPPVCTECHDDKSYPKNSPGPKK